mmetsp:Transcript_8567/g.24174  ORF Transcript_8567/g.24174 Transcript_8567/m.24174 type:complete len:216 (-) Transcript_8567:33-680(-)
MQEQTRVRGTGYVVIRIQRQLHEAGSRRTPQLDARAPRCEVRALVLERDVEHGDTQPLGRLARLPRTSHGEQNLFHVHVVEEEVQLALLETRVQRARHGTHRHQRQERYNELKRIGNDHAHVVARAHTALGQPPCYPHHLPGQLRMRQLHRLARRRRIHQCSPVREVQAPVVQDRPECRTIPQWSGEQRSLHVTQQPSPQSHFFLSFLLLSRLTL